MRMSIGQQIQGAAAVASPEYEPSGSWIRQEDQFLVFSNDGRNWDRVLFAANENPYRAALDVPQYAFPGGDIVLIGQNGSTQSYKMANKAIPNFTPGVNLGNAIWIAKDGGGLWVARTTSVLRTSANGVDWITQTAPVDFASALPGWFGYLPTAGLYISTGQSGNVTQPARYFTSANGISWTTRTFPVNWPGNGGTSPDWVVDNGSVILIGLTDGRIYSSTDAINWTLRATFGATCAGLCWSPALNKFYASLFLANPNNLQSSPDGITWTAVAGHNLDDFRISSGLTADPVKPLLLADGGQANTVGFDFTGQAAYSVDGILWVRRDVATGKWPQHAPFKIGPAPPEPSFNIGSITVSDVAITPTQVIAGLAMRRDNSITEQTTSGGILDLGFWSSFNAENTFNAGNCETRLDWTGDAFNFGTVPPINTWIPMGTGDKSWRYRTAGLGPQILSGSGTLRIRYRDTQEEKGSIAVSVTAEESA